MYSPLKDSDHYFCDGFDDYLLYPSRISPIKGTYLEIEAMKLTKQMLKFILSEDVMKIRTIKKFLR